MDHNSVKPRLSQLFLYSGNDLQITDSVFVHHPKVEEIFQISGGAMCEDIYWSYVFTMLSDPYDHMVWLDDQGIDYEHVTAFQVFVLRWLDAQKEYLLHGTEYAALGYHPDAIYTDALSFFFGKREYTLSSSSQQGYLIWDKADNKWGMESEVFEWASYFIRSINCVDRSDQIKPATAAAKRILIEDKRDELKRLAKKKRDAEPLQQLGAATTTLLFGDSGCVSPFDFSRLPIYHLLMGARSIQKRMVVHSMLNGIHTGMIKTDKMPEEALRWT